MNNRNITEIVDKMYNNDPFSQWLGIKRINDALGQSTLEMEVREEMCNGFGVAHGGISYSFADSALAFSINSHGRKSMSIETSISHILPIKIGDILKSSVKEENLGNKIAVYSIRVTNQKEELVALFKGTVYRSSKQW